MTTQPYPDLYRYIQSPHHISLVDKGQILVGTLKKYKDTLAEDDLRSDRHEGEFTVTQEKDHFSTSADIPESFKKNMPGFNMDQGMNWTFENNKTIRKVPNCLIMSLSTKRNDEILFSKFGKNCFHITDLKSFSEELTITLRETNPDLGIYEPLIKNIIYKSREAHYSEGINSNPAWIKTPDYKVESEFRILWPVNNSENIKNPHYIIENKKISEYIKLVSPCS